LAPGLAPEMANPLEQANRGGTVSACKAVYTGSIPVGASGSGERLFACQSGLIGLRSRMPNPVDSG